MTSTEMRNYFFFCGKCSLRKPVVEKLPFMMSQRSTRQASKSNELSFRPLVFSPRLWIFHILARRSKVKMFYQKAVNRRLNMMFRELCRGVFLDNRSKMKKMKNIFLKMIPDLLPLNNFNVKFNLKNIYLKNAPN